MRRLCVLGLIAVVVVSACTDNDDSTAVVPTVVPSTQSPPTTATTLLPQPTRDLSATPQIWFGPQPPLGPNEFGEERTGPEFYDLFQPDAEWASAAETVHVLHFFGEWAAWRSNPDELAAVIRDLNNRGIAIGIEGGPLVPREGCSDNIEGFAGPREVDVMLDRIVAAGGRVTFVVLEHGFDAVGQLTPECSMSLDEAAADMATYLESVRRVFPNAEFSLTETGGLDVETLDTYLEAFRRTTGGYPGHLMLDVPYGEPRWPMAARAIEDHVRALGIGFGIFYLGEEEDSSDQEWMNHLRDHVVEYEVVYGGEPDRSIFTSWHDYPQNLLPASDAAAFTHVLDWYNKPRAKIVVAIEDGVVTGRLTDVTGSPIAGGSVIIRGRAGSGNEMLQDYVITGTVPEGALMADVGYRINDECACNGTVDLVVEEIRYSEDGGPNPVANPDFKSGLNGWLPWGDANQQAESDGLHVGTKPGQAASINSEMFLVEAGDPFAVTFAARISLLSDGYGYFTTIFHGVDGPIRRFRHHLRPSRGVVDQVITDGDGRFEVAVAAPVAGERIEAWFDGGSSHWPAMAVASS